MARSAGLSILLVCPWTMRIGALRAALREDGIHAEIATADFVARLRAALDQNQFTAAYYVSTPGLPFDVVDSFVRQRAPKLRVIACGDLDGVHAGVRELVRDRRS
jgi:hypothetical protein